MKAAATFSADRVYRYTLTRKWDDLPSVMFIGLNPSTADETRDDPTVRRCIGFAKQWGCGELHMLNLFAFRATDPRVMKRAADPVGPENDAALMRTAAECLIVIAAWGLHGAHLGRGDAVRAMLSDLSVLRLTRDGYPAHPLYLPGNLTPRGWREPPKNTAK